MNHSIYNNHLFTQLNGSKYCYVSQRIHLKTTHLFTELNDQTVLFQAIQLSRVIFLHIVLMSNSSIWPIDMILLGAPSPG